MENSEMLGFFTEEGLIASTCGEYELNPDGSSYTLVKCAVGGTVEIGYYNGLPVTAIADSAFGGNDMVHTVRIGSSVESIGSSAFANCEGLRSFEVAVGSRLKKIGNGAFHFCKELSTVAIPPSVESIGERCFEYAAENIRVCITDLAAWCNIELGGYYSNPVGTLWLCGKRVEELVIPEGVSEIHDFAFSGNYAITSVSIPSGVRSIGRDAFYKCVSVTSLTVGEGVVGIGPRAFYGCERLARVSLPDSVEGIEREAFSECHALAELTLPRALSSVEEKAFYNCVTLKSISLPDGVEEVDLGAFSSLYALEHISVPSSIKRVRGSIYSSKKIKYNEYGNGRYLGNEDDPYLILMGGVNDEITCLTVNRGTRFICECALEDCYSLQSISVEEGSEHLSAFDGCLYSHDGSVLVAYPIGREDTELDLPSCVREIGYGAFSSADKLERVGLPEGLERIGARAFADCESLTDISIPDTVKEIREYAFSCCYALTEIRLPTGVTGLGQFTFEYCKRLARIILPVTVTQIYSSATISCDELHAVYYLGTEKQFERISIEKYSRLASATRYFYSEAEPPRDAYKFWHYGEDGKPVRW